MSRVKRIMISLIIIFLIVCISVYIGSMKWLKIKDVKVNFEDIDDAIEGFRILQISDLHANSKNKMNLDIWQAIEGLDFDIAVITGDIVNGYAQQLDPHMEGIEKLAQRVPVYFVDGNHDKNAYNKICIMLVDAGVIVLNNENTTVKYNDVEINIVGLRDYYVLEKAGFKDVGDLLQPNTGFKIILSHQPQLFDMADASENALMLCGHTHGGQIRLPLLPTLYAPDQGILPKYGDGLYENGKAKMYVSRGIGTTFFPIRFYNRPEVAIIEIVKSS